ncbi:hypothetical protein ACBR40_28450 [Nonomuraea sp. AD125B]|uniref:hypothetical protein n=1 Tax=Nonomuraea sp. AD125B TaxID=3242897 RepID=UPI003528BC8C
MTTYRKKLKMEVRITGTKRGTIKADPSSASGNAVFTTHVTGAIPQAQLAKGARAGIRRDLYGGSYICNAKTMKISGRHVYKDGEHDSWTWWLRRTR